MLKSWKTTVAGIMQFLSIAFVQLQFLLDTDPLTNPDWSVVVASFMVLIGLLFTQDNDVSSENAGAN